MPKKPIELRVIIEDGSGHLLWTVTSMIDGGVAIIVEDGTEPGGTKVMWLRHITPESLKRLADFVTEAAEWFSDGQDHLQK